LTKSDIGKSDAKYQSLWQRIYCISPRKQRDVSAFEWFAIILPYLITTWPQKVPRLVIKLVFNTLTEIASVMLIAFLLQTLKVSAFSESQLEPLKI